MRVTVKNAALVREDHLRASGASGVIRKGNGVQIVYGPRVSVIRSKLEDYMSRLPSDRGALDGALILYSHASGTVVPLEEVGDDAFAEHILGEGIAVEPKEGALYAPCDGRVESVAAARHAVNLISDEGLEILLHVGIDTVKLDGKGFEWRVGAGDRVRRGEVLMTFDPDFIRSSGYRAVIPMVICNADGRRVAACAEGAVSAGDTILRVEEKNENV